MSSPDRHTKGVKQPMGSKMPQQNQRLDTSGHSQNDSQTHQNMSGGSFSDYSKMMPGGNKMYPQPFMPGQGSAGIPPGYGYGMGFQQMPGYIPNFMPSQPHGGQNMN